MMTPHLPVQDLKPTFPGSDLVYLICSEREKSFDFLMDFLYFVDNEFADRGSSILRHDSKSNQGERREERNHKDQNLIKSSKGYRYSPLKIGGKMSDLKHKVFLVPIYFAEDGTYYVVHRPIKRAKGITYTHKGVKFSKEKALAEEYFEVTGDQKSLILEKSRKEKFKTIDKIVNSLNERVWVSPEEKIELLFKPKAETDYEFLYLGKPMEWVLENQQDDDFEQVQKTSRKYSGEQGFLGRVELYEALKKEELNPVARFHLEHYLEATLFNSTFRIKLHKDEKESQKKSSGYRLIKKGKPGRPRKEATA